MRNAMMKCYFCAEEITYTTVVCPWCGRRQRDADEVGNLVKEDAPSGGIGKTLWELKNLPGIGQEITCSDDCLHAAVVRSVGRPSRGFKSEFAVVDGVRFPPCDRITVAADLPVVQFSADGSVWGYSAERKGREFAVINGRESKHYSKLIHPWLEKDLSFSKQGGHFAFGVRSGKNCFMVIDWREMPAFDDVGFFHWNHDGQHYCYKATVTGSECVIVDGQKGPFYERLSWLTLSPQGDHIAYSARSQEGCLLLLDHSPIGEVYENIEDITFSPDGQRVAFWAKKKEASFLVVDEQTIFKIVPGEEETNYFDPEDWMILFSPNGLHIAAVGIHNGKRLLFADGAQIGSYDKVTYLTYTAENQLLYLAKSGSNRWSFVVDGQAQGEYSHTHNLTTDPTGSRYAFQVSQEDHIFMVLDGIAAKRKYDQLVDFRHLKFSPKGSHFSYVAPRGIASRGGGPRLFVVVDDCEKGPYDRVAGTHFVEENLLRFVGLAFDEVQLVEWQL